ncbi:MAG: hypothetical protein FJ029_10805 [Actinobacteria bacterium]|nr:hypothetical protein [Actinomycetota bacterium]
MNFYVVNQLPFLAPSAFNSADIDFVASRALELVHTSNDLDPLRTEMGSRREPFGWNAKRRTELRAELDAYCAHLYGLSRDDLRYILDPQDVLGPDYPGETFRVLKQNELKRYGEYRTRRLVLEAWDRLFGER